MSRYFSRLAGKTGLFPQRHPQRHPKGHSASLQKNASATPFTQPVEHHSNTNSNDITETHDIVNTSSISVTETPALSEKKVDMGASTIENTVFPSTKNTHHLSSQISAKQTDPLPTVKTESPLHHSSVSAKNSDLPDQKLQPDIQPDKIIIPENKENIVKNPLRRSESPFHSSNEHYKSPVNENIDHNTAFSVTTESPLGKKDIQDTTELPAHYSAHKKNRPENTAVPEPAHQPTNSFENERITRSPPSAQSQANPNRQQRVRINIGQISIDIQQSPHKPSPEKVLSPRQIQHSEKPQNRSSAHSPARNETRLSRYYLSGW